MKRNYRVRYFPKGEDAIVVEGKASSAQNACRQAFRLLIKEGKIKNQPPTDPDWPSTFRYTTVEVIEDDETVEVE